jgi:hypothetical protein
MKEPFIFTGTRIGPPLSGVPNLWNNWLPVKEKPKQESERIKRLEKTA